MNNMTKVRTVPFTDSERRDIEKELRSAYFIALIIFLMFIFLLHMAIMLLTNHLSIPGYELALIVLPFLIIAMLAFLSTRKLREEKLLGVKEILFLPIEDKYGYEDREDRFSSVKMKYVVVAQGQIFLVTEEQYNLAENGDFLVLYRTPLRRVVLKKEIIRNTALDNAPAVGH